MDVRKIVNTLIEDIANGTSINQILLKAQIVAFSVDDKRFSQLIKMNNRDTLLMMKFPVIVNRKQW